MPIRPQSVLAGLAPSLTSALAAMSLSGCVYISTTQVPSTFDTAPAQVQAAQTTSALPLEATNVFDQQAEAQATLNRAIFAAGGLDALEQMRDAELTLTVRAARIGQDVTPETAPILGEPSRSVIARKNGRIAIERYNGDTLGSVYVRETLGDWIWFAGPNTVADVEPILAAGIIAQADSSAHLLLEMSDRSEYLRAAGMRVIDGQTYNMISYADTLGRLRTLSFDTSTGHLARAESLSAHAQWGDIATVQTFGDYRTAGGVKLAHNVTTHQASALTSEIIVESVSLEAAAPERFEKPADATVNDPFTAPGSAPRELTVKTLSDGIHFIENAAQGYNVIFVEQSGGILVLETPQSPQSARDIIRTIGEALPDQPIKTAVPTHHHFDHSGGIYGFLEAGIPILTTPGNAGFVRTIGTASRNIGQNTGPITTPVVNTFTGETSLGENGNLVRLINVGPNPHAEEIVVAYIPAIKAVFVADIFSARGEEIPPANENQLAFADRLETLDLDLDIETFIPVHGRKATAAEFWASVEAGRAAQADADTEE